MSETESRTPPDPLIEKPIAPDVRKSEREKVSENVEFFEGIRNHLIKKSDTEAHAKSRKDWKQYIKEGTWKPHGLITSDQEFSYLSTRAAYDINGNNAKESQTVGFLEPLFQKQFPEGRFFLKSQFPIVPKKGPEKQVDNLLGYTTSSKLQQPLIMIEAKRHPKGRDNMTKYEHARMEKQVEEYCRDWLTDNSHIPFLYAVTCASTYMRFWIMERNEDMDKAILKGLWGGEERTWDQYRDPGLDCESKIIKAAIELIKRNPNGSDYASTTTDVSSSESNSKGRSGSRHRTLGQNRSGDRSRSRSRSGSHPSYKPSREEKIPQQEPNEDKQRDRGRHGRGEGHEHPANRDSSRSLSRNPPCSRSSSVHSLQLPIRPKRATKDGKEVELPISKEPNKRGFKGSSSPVPRSSSPENDNFSGSNNRPPPTRAPKGGNDDTRRPKKREKPSGSG